MGVGDGNTKIFNLPWDEAWLTKPHKVYIDGAEKISGVTWSADKLTFDDAPLDMLNITADYWVKYIPKDINHETRQEFSIYYGEGTP